MRERIALVGHMPTQVLYGESVRVLAKRGGWTQIAVPDQPSPLDARGYPGWVRSWQLGPAPAGKTLLVTARTARLANGTEVGFATQVPPGAFPPPRRARCRTRVRISSGPPRSSSASTTCGAGCPAWGYDCSGLTWAVYRAHGITIPRDADAQFAAGTPVSMSQPAAGRPALLRASGGRSRLDVHRRRADDRGAELGERGAHRARAHERLPRRAPVLLKRTALAGTIAIVIFATVGQLSHHGHLSVTGYARDALPLLVGWLGATMRLPRPLRPDLARRCHGRRPAARGDSRPLVREGAHLSRSSR